MTKQEERIMNRYPDSKYFRFCNMNPKHKITGDCTYRAISKATCIPYETVVREMMEIFLSTGYAIDMNHTIDKYLTSKGFERISQPKNPDGTKMTGREFIKSQGLPYGKVYVVSIGSHHLSCIIEGQFHDIWDCSENKVGKVWRLK